MTKRDKIINNPELTAIMIAIIGAGPAGSNLAYLLAKKGKDVSIFEEHEIVGSPVQCTGIVTHSIEKYVKLPNKVIANKCDKVIVISKNNKVEVNVDEIVMWRNKFDEFMAERAQDMGVKVFTNHQFIGFNEKNSIRIKDKKNNKIKEVEAEAIVGADGPSSSVAKAAGINQIFGYYIGMQAKVKLKTDTNAFETYFSNTDFPEFFGWVVPESGNIVRLGLGAKKNAKELFYNFLKRRTGSKDVLCWESGIFPIYNPKQVIQKDNVYLIGDAAAQVKATTGGGIIPSLKAGYTLCDSIINNKNYQSAYKFQSGKELLLHLKLRKILNKFSDKDYDRLLEMMNSGKVKRILKEYDRDTPIPLVLNLLVREPRLLLFLKHLF